MKSVRAIAMAVAVLVTSMGIASAQSAPDQMTGRQTIQGRVTSVSAKTGWVHVKTSEGTFILHFPPSELEGVKKGDTIAVDLAMKDNGPAKAKAAPNK